MMMLLILILIIIMLASADGFLSSSRCAKEMTISRLHIRGSDNVNDSSVLLTATTALKVSTPC
jgi:hypothetical protein